MGNPRINTKMVVSLALASSAIALGAYLASQGLGKKLTIRGERIQVQGTSPLTIHGSFYIGSPEIVDLPNRSTELQIGQTIVSHGTGGACLIADLHLKGIPKSGSCITDSECTNALMDTYTTGKYLDPITLQAKARAWHSYCVDGTCWTRPGPDVSHCVKSINQNGGRPWPTGLHPIPTPPEASIQDMYRELGIGINEPVLWRVHACMNGSNGFWSDSMDCGAREGTGNLNRLINDGPPRSVP
jgi:hypothetical protein